MNIAIAWEWLAFAVRWLHVITAIAWIGSSFYFIALDLGLVKRAASAGRRLWRGMAGAWRRLLSHPEISGCASAMPEHLTWFKWESYVTWLSGFAMLCLVYYGGADLFLIDRHVLDISATTAIRSRLPRSASAGSSTTCSANRRSARTPGR